MIISAILSAETKDVASDDRTDGRAPSRWKPTYLVTVEWRQPISGQSRRRALPCFSHVVDARKSPLRQCNNRCSLTSADVAAGPEVVPTLICIERNHWYTTGDCHQRLIDVCRCGNLIALYSSYFIVLVAYRLRRAKISYTVLKVLSIHAWRCTVHK